MTYKNSETLGKRLKLWRKFIGKNQIEFSELSNIGIAIIRKCESDASMPGGHTLIAFANTGVNIHWLLTGEGSMVISKQASIRPYNQRMIDLGIEMAELSDSTCDDILVEMAIKVKNHLQLQKIERSLEAIRKKSS